MIAIFIPGPPVGFARTRRSKSGHLFTPEKQRDYAEAIGNIAASRMEGEPYSGPVLMQLRATYSVPESWPQKKKDAARWKTSKPDCDNIVKLAKDAMTKIVYRDDAQVVKVVAEKVYGQPEGLTITVQPIVETAA